MQSIMKTTTPNHMEVTQEVQLVYLCSVLAAVNKSCKTLHRISYASGDINNDRRLTEYEVFLQRLALVCDSEKGGDTITALVALKTAQGVGYYFASNNRKHMELEDTKKFLLDLLDYVGRNPDDLAEKPFQKQVLWRILEFNHPRIDFYVKSVVTASANCIEKCSCRGEPSGSETIKQLSNIGDKAKFSSDMMSGPNAKTKFLKDCESLIKAIQFSKDSGFSKVIDERANDEDPDASLPWQELRHALGRLHSYRHAAEVIIAASHEWHALFNGFSVNYVPSVRSVRLPMPMPTPSPSDIIQYAFPDMDIRGHQSHIEELRRYGLDGHIRDGLSQKSIKRLVHCEVLLHDFLVRNGVEDLSSYWNNSMFIATSKPPCRLCHYYFSNIDSDFKVQSPHMNIYPKWRLPDIYENSGPEAFDRQLELLEDIIEQMQHDTLRILKEKYPEWQRNDSRTESRTGSSTMPGYTAHGGRSETRQSGPFPGVVAENTEDSMSMGTQSGAPLVNGAGEYNIYGMAR